MTVTANENLIFLDPLPASPSPELRDTYLLDARTLPSSAQFSPYVKPAATGKHWPK
jgi:hypothetical protein